MITVLTTAGAQAEGVAIFDGLENELFPSMSEAQKATAVGDRLKAVMAIWLAAKKNWTIQDALTYVEQNTGSID